MRLLANENMPGSVVELLRQKGHDVLAVKESLRGAKDIDILARAQAELRVLISQGKELRRTRVLQRLAGAVRRDLVPTRRRRPRRRPSVNGRGG